MTDIALIAIFCVVFTYLVRCVFQYTQSKLIGNKLPGPTESFLWGNAADMQAQGGLVLFLDHLHERCGSCNYAA